MSNIQKNNGKYKGFYGGGRVKLTLPPLEGEGFKGENIFVDISSKIMKN